MNKVSVSLLLASLVIGVPSSSGAEPVSRGYVNDSFAITVRNLLASNGPPRINGVGSFS
jgi:hypothetical protein